MGGAVWGSHAHILSVLYPLSGGCDPGILSCDSLGCLDRIRSGPTGHWHWHNRLRISEVTNLILLVLFCKWKRTNFEIWSLTLLGKPGVFQKLLDPPLNIKKISCKSHSTIKNVYPCVCLEAKPYTSFTHLANLKLFSLFLYISGWIRPFLCFTYPLVQNKTPKSIKNFAITPNSFIWGNDGLLNHRHSYIDPI